MDDAGAVPKSSDQPAPAAWKLPLIVAAISTSIFAGFYLGGPGLGMAIGAAAAAAILVLAARRPPLGPIVPPVANDLCRHVLLVLEAPLQSPAEIRAAVAATRIGAADVFTPDVLLLVPCATRRLDRWTSDLGPARRRAGQTLALSRAALARDGIAAADRIGDEDLVQAVEDTLRSFPATEVVIVGDQGQYDEDQRVAELRSRLQIPLRITAESIRALPAGSRRLRKRGMAPPAVRGRGASRSAR